MPKHRLSPEPLPATKRHHGFLSQRTTSKPLLSFDSALHDELILLIFSFLSWSDLCIIQPTNHLWARLAADNQLWKNEYMHEYRCLRLRGSRGFILPRKDGREIKPPSRHGKYKAGEESLINWKWMFRISSNWRRGRCEVEESSIPTLNKSSLEKVSRSCALLAGQLTITSVAEQLQSPPIYLNQRDSPPYILKGKHRTNGPTYVTTLSLDQSPPAISSGERKVRLAAFYDTGEFSIFLVDHDHPQRSHRLLTYFPQRSERTTPIRQAVYYHPLLVTLSQSFHLSIYNCSDDNVVHTQTLTSFTSFHPTSMVLTSGKLNYRLVISYSSPVYPQHWSVAVTVLTISSPLTSQALPSLIPGEHISEIVSPYTVISTRTIRSHDVPLGWINEKAMRLVREQWGRKVARVADTQTDGKWVVLAPSDKSPGPPRGSSSQIYFGSSIGTTACALQLYRLQIPSPPSGAAPRLTFVRMLYGHTGPVSALALADGRCVSLGTDGSIWVWDLERAWGAEVQAPCRLPSALTDEYLYSGDDAAEPLGAVVFDERRIVTSDNYGIECRRFDV